MHKCYRRLIVPFVLLLLDGMTSQLVIAAQPQIKFTHVTIEQGLSQNTVYSIIQDRKGFLWLGTEDGLNRYDGYSFKVYKYDPDDPSSLSNSVVTTVYEDRTGFLWVGTHDGLNRFDPQTGIFTRYLHDPGDPYSLSHNHIYSLLEDRQGTLWVATRRHGLNSFDPATGRFTRYRHAPDTPGCLPGDTIGALYETRDGSLWIGLEGKGLAKFDPKTGSFLSYRHNPRHADSLGSDTVWAIVEDQNGMLWIGTSEGLDRLDPDAMRFSHYRHSPDNSNSLSSDAISSLLIDRQQRLWVGTADNGVNLFDRENMRFFRYQPVPNNPNSLNDSLVISIFEDDAGILFFGTYSGGLNIYDPQAQKFLHYQAVPGARNSLNDNVIWSIYEDPDEILWLGTSYGGLNRFNRKTGAFAHYLHDEQNSQSVSGNKVLSIYEDREQVLWVGTRNNGLNRFDRATETFHGYCSASSAPHCTSGNKIWSISEDRHGTLWIGTNNGLNAFDRRTERFTQYLHDSNRPESLGHAIIYKVFSASDGSLWLGTGGGLDKFIPESGRFTHHRHDAGNPNSLCNDTVFAIHEDRNGLLWIGTWGGGLDRFDPQTETFTHYREKDGLPNNVIYGILEDAQGHLWVSTNRGLSRFDPETETFKNYDTHDGLQSNEYNLGAYYAGRSGTFFFGGINGFNAFRPEDIRDNSYVPPLVITDFQLFNTSVAPGVLKNGRTILTQPIEVTDSIELSHLDNVFTFEFAALHYSSPENNQYAYRLLGFDTDWNLVGTRRIATYTNLPHGEYVFQVKGTNSDELWNKKGREIRLTILPAFWETWWFYLLVGGAILFVMGIFYVQQIRKMRVENTARLLAGEMELAKRIQTSLLPQDTSHPHFNISAKMLSVNHVGGDYYDLVHTEDGSFWLGIGDVSGDGVTPGLIMMMAQTIHATIVRNYTCRPSEVLAIVNKMLYGNVQERLRETHHMTFTTIKYLGDGVFEYAGGHDDMIIYRRGSGSCEVIETDGIYLNQVEDIGQYTQNTTFHLNIGDVLLLYTDGLIEVENDAQELLTIQGLIELVQQHAGKNVVEMRDAILAEALKWCGNPPYDDITLVVARRIQ